MPQAQRTLERNTISTYTVFGDSHGQWTLFSLPFVYISRFFFRYSSRTIFAFLSVPHDRQMWLAIITTNLSRLRKKLPKIRSIWNGLTFYENVTVLYRLQLVASRCSTLENPKKSKNKIAHVLRNLHSPTCDRLLLSADSDRFSFNPL